MNGKSDRFPDFGPAIIDQFLGQPSTDDDDAAVEVVVM